MHALRKDSKRYAPLGAHAERRGAPLAGRLRSIQTTGRDKGPRPRHRLPSQQVKLTSTRALIRRRLLRDTRGWRISHKE